MAKEGIDSFLLDCHTNENLSEIEASFGIKGFAVIVRLWQKIYSEKGYYCEWIERSPLLFLANWFGGNSGVDLNLIKEVIATALRIGIFEQELYEKYSILTSEGIQRRYFDVVKRRTELTIVEEYLLVSVDNLRGNICKISISADKNAKNVCKKDISKVKESKEKKREVKSKGADKPQGLSMVSMIEARGFPAELEAVIKEWAAYKTEKRQGYKETGFNSLLTQIANKVEAYGVIPVIDVIRESMSNNWQGIIWDRIKANPYQGGNRSSPRSNNSPVEQFADKARRWAEDD